MRKKVKKVKKPSQALRLDILERRHRAHGDAIGRVHTDLSGLIEKMDDESKLVTAILERLTTVEKGTRDLGQIGARVAKLESRNQRDLDVLVKAEWCLHCKGTGKIESDEWVAFRKREDIAAQIQAGNSPKTEHQVKCVTCAGHGMLLTAAGREMLRFLNRFAKGEGFHDDGGGGQMLLPRLPD